MLLKFVVFSEIISINANRKIVALSLNKLGLSTPGTVRVNKNNTFYFTLIFFQFVTELHSIYNFNLQIYYFLEKRSFLWEYAQCYNK